MKALVANVGADLLGALGAGLADAGADVRTIAPSLARPQIVQAVNEAVAADGPPDLVVASVVPAEALALRPLMGLSPVQWRACVVAPLRATMWLLDALGVHLKGRGGAIAFAAPSLSLAGAPQLVALSTLLEGQRGLVKSVARQWGGAGVRLNWIAVAPRALSPAFAGAPLATKPDAVSVALGAPLDPRAEVAPIVAFLASQAGRGMTGLTLTLDGGEWMTP